MLTRNQLMLNQLAERMIYPEAAGVLVQPPLRMRPAYATKHRRMQRSPDRDLRQIPRTAEGPRVEMLPRLASHPTLNLPCFRSVRSYWRSPSLRGPPIAAIPHRGPLELWVCHTRLRR